MYVPKPENWNLMSKEGKKLWELTEGRKLTKSLQATSEVLSNLKDEIDNGKIEETDLPF